MTTLFENSISAYSKHKMNPIHALVTWEEQQEQMKWILCDPFQLYQQLQLHFVNGNKK